jgi:hypothetical protein
VDLLPPATGTCAIHVALKDGETFDDVVQVTDYSGCCSGIPNGDHTVQIMPHRSGVDASVAD